MQPPNFQIPQQGQHPALKLAGPDLLLKCSHRWFLQSPFWTLSPYTFTLTWGSALCWPISQVWRLRHGEGK